MLMPKRVKRRKQFRGSMAGKATRGTTITYGDFGLVACDPCWIKSNPVSYTHLNMSFLLLLFYSCLLSVCL